MLFTPHMDFLPFDTFPFTPWMGSSANVSPYAFRRDSHKMCRQRQLDVITSAVPLECWNLRRTIAPLPDDYGQIAANAILGARVCVCRSVTLICMHAVFPWRAHLCSLTSAIWAGKSRHWNFSLIFGVSSIGRHLGNLSAQCEWSI